MIKVGLYPMPANTGKRAAVEAVFTEYQRTAVAIGRLQWQRFFTVGRLNRNDTTKVPSRLSARYVQTCRYQVVAQLTGFLGNCGNAFKEHVQQSSLDPATRIALLYLNKYRSWFRGDVQMQGVPVPAETLRLARAIMRHVFKVHGKPDLRRVNLALDEKVATVECAQNPDSLFSHWIRLATLEKGRPIWLPLRPNRWFEAVPGELKAFCQLNRDEAGMVWAGLIKEVAPTPYVPQLDILGLDVGLKHLLASSEGDLLGNDVLLRLKKLDRQLSALAANRQRMGLRVRSARYDGLVARMRALLKNEIHRTLKAVLLRHRPAHVAVERLDFRAPGLSRRMNRLVQNFGRRVFQQALEGYAEQYGFAWSEVEPAYSSQTCRCCGYVDPRNRKGEVFRCLHCGHREQADIHAGRNLAARLREDLGRSELKWSGRRRSRAEILDELVRCFASPEQQAFVQRQAPRLTPTGRKRRDSTPRRIMLSNPHFRAVLAPPPRRERASPLNL